MRALFVPLLGLAAIPLALGSLALRAGSPSPVSVAVTATDYALAAPDTLPEGAVTFHLTNQGKEFHHLWVIRLEQGKTIGDLVSAVKSGAFPAWARSMGGPNAPRPGGGEASATLVLAPGRYVLACGIPSPDGVPHFMKGMMRSLAVVPTPGAAGAPQADLTMSLRDYSFALSGAPAAGRHVIEVRNDGEQTHEVELVRLAPGKSVYDVLAWIEKPEGPPPGLPLGGISPMARGGVASFEVEFAPGRYGMICFLPDAKDGKAHHEHGMIQEFEVPASLSAR
jgi:hypothetical protein